MQVHVPKPLHGWRAGFLLTLCCSLVATSARAQAVPAAIDQDPPLDRLHPASGAGLQFVSKGKLVNAMEYLPSGVGAHPAVILLHGLPGNEQNLDLARAMQRAGWAVITFHYRGSWGSGGNFTLQGGCSDVDALLRDIIGPNGLGKWHVDPHRIVVAGHSYGGFVATCSAQRHPEFAAVALIAPWDISYDARRFSKLSQRQADRQASSVFNDVDGRLAGATALSLMRYIRKDGSRLRLTDATAALARRPLLLVTATRDDPDDQAVDLRPALEKAHPKRVTYRLFNTDHGFNDQRIGLETFVLEWLGSLPIAPRTDSGAKQSHP